MNVSSNVADLVVPVVSSIVVALVSQGVELVGPAQDQPIVEVLRMVGGQQLVVVWAGFVMGWLFHARRVAKGANGGRESNRIEREGTSSGGNTPTSGRSGIDTKSEGLFD